MRARAERYWILAAALALAACVPALAQSGEGYDPMLQITHQFAHPNILIAQDVSGSMTWDINGNTVGQDCYGGVPTWTVTSSTTGCRNGMKYSYRLRLPALPSRLCILKNALGNAVTLYEVVPPATWPAYSGYTLTTSGGLPTYTSACQNAAPGPPFTVTLANAATFSFMKVTPPQNLVGNTSSSVNWGLMTWSAPGGTARVTNVQDVNADDSNQAGAVTTIQNALRLQVNGGIGADGNTPASYALNKAKESLNRTYSTGYNGGPDPKISCNRLYAVIFVTDGQSNSCNPSGGYWGCDTSTTTWYDYPAGRTNELFLRTADVDSGCINATVTRMRAQTFVIGVSDDIARCELNLDAYFGRTDASSSEPATWSGSARLPQNTTGTTSTSRYSTASDYAYFANSASALKDAFAAIVAAVAAGDYTTGAPVASSTAQSGSTVFLSSAEFPSWRGHLYAFDTSLDPADPNYLMWDSGQVLTNQSASTRRIYTWNSSGALVAVTQANLTQLQTIAAAYTPGFTGTLLTANVVDFIRGNNGSLTNTSRAWKLGPVVNSTPAVITKPQQFRQGLVEDHSVFEAAHATREPLLYTGADDGMFHAFLTADKTISGTAYVKGSELFAVLPPNLLARQVDLFNYFDPVKRPLGQPQMPSDHIYGAANSPRFGDVWFPTPGVYKTLLFVTEGPGGAMLAALDVTDPVAVLEASSTAVPFGLVWHKTGATLTGLQSTWSLPAFGASTGAETTAVMGSGYDSTSAVTNPYAYYFDPVDGSFQTNGQTLGNLSTGTYVRNQAFADSVIFSRSAKAFFPDNLVTQALQADLHGRLWFMNTNQWRPALGIDATGVAGHSQPIYYPPSAGGFYKGTTGYDIYAFASGSFYEKDPDVTGTYVGQTGYFVPSFYAAANTPMDGSVIPSTRVLRIPIQSVTYEAADGTTKNLGRRTQVVASPLMLIPSQGSTANPTALFVCYDPDSAASCAGESFVVKFSFEVSATGAPTGTTSAYSAGEGAASGFTISGDKVIVAKSSVGQGSRASISEVPGVNPTEGFTSPTPIWWRELQ